MHVLSTHGFESQWQKSKAEMKLRVHVVNAVDRNVVTTRRMTATAPSRLYVSSADRIVRPLARWCWIPYEESN